MEPDHSIGISFLQVGIWERSKLMNTFVWDDVIYEFDANQCYNDNSHVRLPNGTILKVTGWYETMPPKPIGLRKVTYLDGMCPFLPTKAILVETP